MSWLFNRVKSRNISPLIRRAVALLDIDWYLRSYPDVVVSGLGAEEHFARFGFYEGRNPNALFDTDWYRHLYAVAPGHNCLQHYLVEGWRSGNEPSICFDSEWYGSQVGQGSDGASPLEHFWLIGWKRHLDPHPLFDSVWYLGQKPRGLDVDRPAFAHYLDQGWRDDVSPSPAFMPGTYLSLNEGVAEAGVNPFLHFLSWGKHEDRSTSELVDSDYYKGQYPDDHLVHKWGSEAHFARFGWSEGRKISRDPLAQEIMYFAAASASRSRRFATNPTFGTSSIDPIDWSARAKSIEPLTSLRPRVTVVIPTFNHADDVIRCVESIRASGDSTPIEIVVVDDCSSLNEAELMREIRGVRVVSLTANRGFAGACTVGVEESTAEFVLLLNNDTEVLPGWIDSLVATMDARSGAGVVGSMVLRADLRLQEAGGIIWSDGTGAHYGSGVSPVEGYVRYLREVDYCSGASLLVRRRVWNDVGGFDAELAPAYYEDADLCFAARSRGHEVVVQPNSRILHREGSSHGRGSFGLKRKQYINRQTFVDKWHHELLDAPCPTASNDWINVACRDRRKAGHVLVCDHQHLEPNSDAGSVRMDAILRALANRGLVVHFYAAGSLKNPAWVDSISSAGVEVLESGSRIDDFLVAHRDMLDFVLVSRPAVMAELSSSLSLYAPRVPLVYDMVDAHGLRLSRRSAITGSQRDIADALHITAVECRASRLADVTIVVSRSDEEYIERVAGHELTTLVIPTIHQAKHRGASFDERSGLLFVGGFQHDPNVDAVRFLVNEVLPLTRGRLANLKLTIVGSRVTEEVSALRGDDIEVLGWVEDLEPVYSSARLVVAPLRYGAGVKGKIGEALSHFVPVVTTSIGAEGYLLQSGRDFLVGDSAQEIADHIVAAYSSRETWESLSANGAKAIENTVGLAALDGMLDELLRIVRQVR